MAGHLEEIVIPYFDEELNGSAHRESAIRILKHVRPDWNPEHILVEEMKGGCVNVMLCCHLVEDDDKKEALIVRIHGFSEYTTYLNRKAEIPSFAMGHRTGCNQPVHAIFRNGLVLGYAPGRAVNYDMLFDQKIAREIVRNLAKFHSINIDKYRVLDTRGHIYEVEKTPVIWNQWRSMASEVEENRFEDGLPTREQLFREIDSIKRRIDKLGIPVVYCLVDSRYDNLVYDYDTGVVFYYHCPIHDGSRRGTSTKRRSSKVFISLLEKL